MESLYRRHRFPPEIISHVVWLYQRFTLSFRDVEDLLAERGVTWAISRTVQRARPAGGSLHTMAMMRCFSPTAYEVSGRSVPRKKSRGPRPARNPVRDRSPFRAMHMRKA